MDCSCLRSSALSVGLGAAFALSLLLEPAVAYGETPSEAIARIRSRPHNAMPAPQRAHATGPQGKGMTIENGTGNVLRVHFSGPVTRSVEVTDGTSAGVELAVGTYDVAAEVPNSSIVPFYGRQDYEPNTHYWLKFYVQTRFR